MVLPRNDIWEKQSRNSILMVCHYPDLDSASDWLSHTGKQKFASTSRKQSWVVAHHQCGISAIVPQTQFHEKTWKGSGNLRSFWFLSLRILLNADKINVFYGVTCLAGGLTVIKVLYTEFTRAKSAMFFTNTWIINPFFKLSFKLLSVSMEIKTNTKFLVVPSKFKYF